MDYEVHFVHAPSASGKTTFLKTGKAGPLTILRDQDHVIEDVLYRHGNCGFVDGDTIVHFTIGWPLNKEWFKDRDATYVHAAQLFALVNTSLRIKAPPWMTDLVIMFNGGMKKLAVAEKLYAVERGSDTPVKLHHHFMIPPREDHERNIESRRQENLKEGRSWTFPANWGDAHNNRESTRKMAEAFGEPVMDSFDSVLKSIKADYSGMDDKSTDEDTQEAEESASQSTNGWKFHFAAHGFKDTDPPNGGSTRIVWKHDNGWYLVMKLFDDGGFPFPEEPRTIKFWKTSNFREDLMAWTSAQHRFDPDDEQQKAFAALLKEMIEGIPFDSLPDLYEN